jgi:hypothetical protein
MAEEQQSDYGSTDEDKREIIENMAAQQRALDDAARRKDDGSDESAPEREKDFIRVVQENTDMSDVMTAEEMVGKIADE